MDAGWWRYEKLCAERAWLDFRSQRLGWILGEVGAVLIGSVVAGAVGGSFDLSKALLAGLLTFVLLTLLLALFHLGVAPHRIHTDQSAKIVQLQARIDELQPGEADSEPRAPLRALRDHDDKSAGDFYGVPFSNLDRELRSGNAEEVTPQAALRWLLESVERTVQLVAEFRLSPPQYGRYYPHPPKLRQRWRRALGEMRECLDAALRDEQSRPAQWESVRLWLGLLEDETNGEGRIEQYQDRARHLQEWVKARRAEIQS